MTPLNYLKVHFPYKHETRPEYGAGTRYSPYFAPPGAREGQFVYRTVPWC